MPADSTQPIQDSVAKVGGELAVGSDPRFQRHWWYFERGCWVFFALLVALDLAGVLGRGPVARASRDAADGSLRVEYERIERYQSPSMLTVEFTGHAPDDKVQLWMDGNLVEALGNQRVIPQPESSSLVDGGILYRFPIAASRAGRVQFDLHPTRVGLHRLRLHLADARPLELRVLVLP